MKARCRYQGRAIAGAVIAAAPLMIVASCAHQEQAATVACATPSGAAGTRFFLDVPTAADGDSLASVRVCLGPSDSPVGSYHATVEYDTSLVRLVTGVVAANGMQVVNSNVAGVVAFAGAAPSGFAPGVLATVTLRPSRPRVLGKLKVTLAELNTSAGTDLRGGAVVTGFPSADSTLGAIGPIRVAAAATPVAVPAAAPARPSHKTLTWIAANPHIDSLSPSSASLAGDAVVEVVIHGVGFTPAGNVVSFGDVEVGALSSEKGIIRFVVPVTIPSHGEVPPRRVGPGEFVVQVRNGSGASNALTFTVRG